MNFQLPGMDGLPAVTLYELPEKGRKEGRKKDPRIDPGITADPEINSRVIPPKTLPRRGWGVVEATRGCWSGRDDKTTGSCAGVLG